MLVDQVFSTVLEDTTSTVSVIAGAVILLVGLGLLRWHAGLPDELWMVAAIGALGLVLVLNLATNDSGGGGAQLAFLFPVVYAGAFLRPAAAWTVAATASVASAVSVAALVPFERAIGEYPFLLVSIVALNAVLLASGRRQDRLVAQLDALASVDALTGLATRRAITDAADAVLAAAAEGKSVGTILMILDVDRFKLINDTYGHPVGDAVLTHLGHTLRTIVREGDTVARFGGDELAVLLPNTSADEALRRARELMRAIRANPLVREGGDIPLTVSVGIAHTPVGNPDLKALYVAADLALYRAKHLGRDRIEIGVVGEASVADADAEQDGDVS